MTTRAWLFELDGQPHSVVIEHGAFSGKRNLWVDGQLRHYSETFRHLVFDTGSRHAFTIGPHAGLLTIGLWALGFLGFRYTLTIDGQPIAARPAPPRPGGCLLAWLSLVVVANAFSFLAYLLLLALGGLPGAPLTPITTALYVGFALLALCYTALSLAALRRAKAAVIGLYILLLMSLPLVVTYMLTTLGSLGMRSPLPILLAAVLSLLAALLGLLGIVILASLLQESGYLRD